MAAQAAPPRGRFRPPAPELPPCGSRLPRRVLRARPDEPDLFAPRRPCPRSVARPARPRRRCRRPLRTPSRQPDADPLFSIHRRPRPAGSLAHRPTCWIRRRVPSRHQARQSNIDSALRQSGSERLYMRPSFFEGHEAAGLAGRNPCKLDPPRACRRCAERRDGLDSKLARTLGAALRYEEPSGNVPARHVPSTSSRLTTKARDPIYLENTTKPRGAMSASPARCILHGRPHDPGIAGADGDGHRSIPSPSAARRG